MEALEVLKKIEEMKPSIDWVSNDVYRGVLFSKICKEECRYNYTTNQWMCYDGTKWITDERLVEINSKRFYEPLLHYSHSITDQKTREVFQSYVQHMGRLGTRKTMVEDAKAHLGVYQNELDNEDDLFNCQNGTFNLKTFEFQPHNPNDLLTKISNVVYDENAKSWNFENFFRDVMCGNQEKMNYVQKVLGNALTTNTRDETSYMCIGSGRNGKGVLFNTIAHVLGNDSGYAQTMSYESLAERKFKDGSKPSPDLARLLDVRFAIIPEPEKNMVLDSALFKKMTGRDRIPARLLYKNIIEFIPVCKFFFNTNHLPLITDDVIFTSGRLNVISFRKEFSADEQDRNLKDNLISQENVSGIFNWLIEGLKKYNAEGAIPPQCVKDDTMYYSLQSDKIKRFFNECMAVSDDNVKGSDVHRAYEKWCFDNGTKGLGKEEFFKELRRKKLMLDLGTVNGKTEKNVVKGYSIIENAELIKFTDTAPEYEQYSFS